MSVFLCLSLSVSVCLCLSLSVSVCHCLRLSPSVCVCLCLCLCLSVSLSVRPSICPSVRLSVCLSVCLSACILSACVRTCVFAFLRACVKSSRDLAHKPTSFLRAQGAVRLSKLLTSVRVVGMEERPSSISAWATLIAGEWRDSQFHKN